MMLNRFCQVWVTCADRHEAQKIATVLLEKKLVACAKYVPVGADFLWEGSVDHNDEILMIMETREDLFGQIAAEIEKHHSYDTPVIQAISIMKLSKDAEKWLQDSLLQ